MHQIMAGVGEAGIEFEENMFPTPGEGYTGVHDVPYAHAYIFRQGEETFVFLGLNLVSYPSCEKLQELASERTGAAKETVFIHCNHNVATPHAPFHLDTAEEILYGERYEKVVEEAVRRALEAAASDIREADVSFHVAVSSVNTSRMLHVKGGLWQGSNDAGVTDHTVPVICIRDHRDHSCRGILYAVNMAPGVMEGSFLSDGGRLITGDIAGYSEQYLKEAFPQAVCCYCLGASGDQWQSARAVLDRMTPEGDLVKEDLHEEGFVLARMMGSRLASAITIALRGETPAEDGTILAVRRESVYPGQKEVGRSAGAMKPGPVTFEPGEDVVSDIVALRIGDIFLIGAHAEINVATLERIRVLSGSRKIFFTAFTNGAGGYMTEQYVYDAGGYQSRKSTFRRGSAELFQENVAALIREMGRN